MRKQTAILLIVLAVVVYMFCGCSGPTGPEGPRGQRGLSGEDAEIIILTGILTTGDRIESEDNNWNYWDILLNTDLSNSIVTVHVREGSESMWVEPYWYLGSHYVRIFEGGRIVGENTEPGNEYRIAISN